MSEQWFYDPSNSGVTHECQCGLVDENGVPVGVHVSLHKCVAFNKYEDDPDAERKGKLASAAPDLLAACKAAKVLLANHCAGECSTCDWCSVGNALEKLDAAIAKAEVQA